MKVNQIIDEIQALLTKFRERVRLTGTAGETATEAMMREELEGHLKSQIEYCNLHDWLSGKTDKKPPIADKVLNRLSETAGECTCHHYLLDCPLCHPRMDQYYQGVVDKAYKKEWEKQNPPDLPLRVRVAKALGKKIKYYDGKWRMMIPHVDVWWRCPAIPDYPNDLVAAMGALEEYKEKAKTCPIKIQLNSYSDGKLWFVTISCDYNDERNIIKADKSLPQAICEAIVAHAEGK